MNGSKIQCLPQCCIRLDSFHSLPLHTVLCVCGKYPADTAVSHSGTSFEKQGSADFLPHHNSYAFIAVCVLWCLTDLLFLPSSIKDWQSELLYCSIKDSHTEVAHLMGPLA